MLTPDEERALRELLEQRADLDAMIDAPRLTPTEIEITRAITQQYPKLQGVLRESQTVGAPALLRRLFVLEAEGEQTVSAASAYMIVLPTIPVNSNTDPAHTFYLPSVYVKDDVGATILSHASGVWSDGVTFPTAGIHAGIVRYREAGPPDEIVVWLQLYNSHAADLDVLYKVYRLAGLT